MSHRTAGRNFHEGEFNVTPARLRPHLCSRQSSSSSFIENSVGGIIIKICSCFDFDLTCFGNVSLAKMPFRREICKFVTVLTGWLKEDLQMCMCFFLYLSRL